MKQTLDCQYIKRHSPDVELIQESHLKGSRLRALDKFGYKLVAHSGYSSGARGVGILIRSTLSLTITGTWSADTGCCAVVAGKWEGRSVAVCSFYIPPRLYTITLPKISAILVGLPLGTFLAGGDVNVVIDPELDRSSARAGQQGDRDISNFLLAMGLTDLWRHTTQQHSNTHSIQPDMIPSLELIITLCKMTK